MLTIYAKAPEGGALHAAPNLAPDDANAVWIDLEHPTDAEEQRVEQALGIDVPTPDERGAEEDSARFYEENGALTLTATLLGRRDEGLFLTGPVTFVLVKGKLVTVRQIRPRSFEIGQGRASARIGAAKTGGEVLLALLSSVIERLADIIAETRKSARELSAEIFAEQSAAPPLRETLRALGRLGSLAALSQETLASLQRLVTYAAQRCDSHGVAHGELDTLAQDIRELERGAAALETHLNLLQEATLGLVGAEQNNTLKALALATIAFVPPTLIASIFGMNFMPGMTWYAEPWGPWAAFAIMAAAPLTLFFLARWRRWF